MNENNRGTPDSNFTHLTFDEIRKRILTHAESYYPETYKDFNKSSFGSMMIDVVSLVSEQLNFYAQFVGNETLSVSSCRSPMVLDDHESEVGDPTATSMTSYGIVKFYTLAPADALQSGVDLRYKHKILKGARLTSPEGGVFTTIRDATVDLNSEYMVGTSFSTDGSKVNYYIYETEIPVVSGETKQLSVEVGNYTRFLKVEIKDYSVSETIEVVDSSGNKYYEVDNLAHDTIYMSLPNIASNSDQVPSIMKEVPVQRRYVLKKENGRYYLQFGYGTENETIYIKGKAKKKIARPFNLSSEVSGKEHDKALSFDSSMLGFSNKFGISPQNTTLTITYRSNTTENTNAAAGTINNVSNAEIIFEDQTILEESKMSYIKNNVTVNNDDPINGQRIEYTTTERAINIAAKKGTNGRCVTARDYVAASYLMPSKFGKISRASIDMDRNDLRRSLNLYVMSQDRFGKLEIASKPLKQNLKTWINSVKMITDSIDIFDAKILNLGLEFDISLNKTSNYASALSEIREALYQEITAVFPQIGEPFSIFEVERILNSLDIVNGVISVKVKNKIGTNYSDTRHNIAANVSPDGKLVYVPADFIWEIKNSKDIVGKVK